MLSAIIHTNVLQSRSAGTMTPVCQFLDCLIIYDEQSSSYECILFILIVWNVMLNFESNKLHINQ